MGEFGRALSRLKGDYGLTNTAIAQYGGPDTVTLSRLSHQPDSIPVNEEIQERLVLRLVDSFTKAVLVAYNNLPTEEGDFRQELYQRIKLGLERDVNKRREENLRKMGFIV